MPTQASDTAARIYHSGFGNHVSTEALPGALPLGRNSPQRPRYGLYAEQISGTAFTAPRAHNRRTWMYRIRPSVVHSPFTELAAPQLASGPFAVGLAGPNQLRWDPLPDPGASQDFVDGLFTMCGNGEPSSNHGVAVHLYACNRDMADRFFHDADGELLIVPQMGALVLRTELGVLDVAPGSIGVVPRGIKFQVNRFAGEGESNVARGYVCENYGAPFALPELGPIGANGLANARDFESPAAAFDQATGQFELVTKFSGQLWRADLDHSPLDVVAWHGNHTPYRYDLARFNAMNTVSFDHADPSIFTVLTSASAVPGTANCDFVIFPPRWAVAEDTFRPPWFHRNVMSEFMGLVHGVYDAKAHGFAPGGSSLHNCMSPHGPDAETYERATTTRLAPTRIADTLAFMFESCRVFHPTARAVRAAFRQQDYQAVWQGLRSHFDSENR